MPYVASYSNITTAEIPEGSWEEAWAFLASWRGFLPSIPGFLESSIGARRIDDERVRIHTVTTWEELEQLEEWLASEWTAAKSLARLTHPPDSVSEEVIEDYA